MNMCVDDAALVSLGRKIDRLTQEVHDLAREIMASRLAGSSNLPRAPTDRTANNDEELLDTKQVATLVNRTASTVKDWRGRGKGPPFLRLPGSQQVLYRRDEVMSWLETGEYKPTPRPRPRRSTMRG